MAAVAPSVYRGSVRWYDNSSMIFNNVRYVMDWLDARFAGMNHFLD